VPFSATLATQPGIGYEGSQDAFASYPRIRAHSPELPDQDGLATSGVGVVARASSPGIPDRNGLVRYGMEHCAFAAALQAARFFWRRPTPAVGRGYFAAALQAAFPGPISSLVSVHMPVPVPVHASDSIYVRVPIRVHDHLSSPSSEPRPEEDTRDPRMPLLATPGSGLTALSYQTRMVWLHRGLALYPGLPALVSQTGTVWSGMVWSIAHLQQPFRLRVFFGAANPGRWPGLFCSSPSGCISRSHFLARFRSYAGTRARSRI
jgi:hypothetical protein